MKSKGRAGELNHKAKLTPENVNEIRSTGQSETALAERFGVTTGTISDIRQRRSWRHLPDPPFQNEAGEEWRAVPLKDFAARYEVSNHGRIRSLKLQRSVRRVFVSPFGYQRVHLCLDYRKRDAFVHRLVAIAFLGPVPKGKEVNHIDGNKLNNAVSNLEYITPQENKRHAVKHGLTARGERNIKAKLTATDVRAIRLRSEYGYVVAADYGVSNTTINNIRARRTWGHVI